MAVGKISSYVNQVVKQPQEVQRRSGDDPQVAGSGKDSAVATDRVQFSKGYQEVAKVTKVIMDRDEIRSEQVDHYRNLIESGQYKVEPAKIAEKALEETF